MVWSTWSAHSPTALRDLELARHYFESNAIDVLIATTTEPASLEMDVMRMIDQYRVQLPRIRLASERVRLTEAYSQVPATLMFRNGTMIDRRLGARTFDELREWVFASLDSDNRIAARETLQGWFTRAGICRNNPPINTRAGMIETWPRSVNTKQLRRFDLRLPSATFCLS
jgi:hypothetical protein